MTGKPATDYPRVFDLIAAGAVDMGRLVTATVGLEDITSVFQRMDRSEGVGVTVIDRF